MPDYRLLPRSVHYSSDIEEAIAHLGEAIERVPDLRSRYAPRWLAIQLLEGDDSLRERVGRTARGADVLSTLDQSTARLRETIGDDIDLALTDQRYRFVHRVAQAVTTRPPGSRKTPSDAVDQVVTNQAIGIPLFLVLMWGIFKLTTDVAGPFVTWIEQVVGGPLTNQAIALLGLVGLTETWVEHLVVDGMIAGVGGVLVFVPILMSLYLALAILEDSGYMARAAFVMDRLMHPLGLHGKSFLPMIVGFGCTVPAFATTRTLENQRDRILTGLLVPFMSCGGRLPVYVLLATLFFPEKSGLVVWGIYLLGIFAAIILGMVLKHTLFRGKERSPFLMELPPYRWPSLKTVWFLTWSRTSSFIKKAGTLILAFSVVIWFLSAIPIRGEGTFANTDLDDSALASLTTGIAPVFAPLGFGSWETGGALVTGLVAKELIVSTMAQIQDVAQHEAAEAKTAPHPTLLEDLSTVVTSLGEAVASAARAVPSVVGIQLSDNQEEREDSPAALHTALRESFERSSGGHGALAGLAFMVFVLLYPPCVAALATEKQELGTPWMIGTIVGQLVLAWVVGVFIFQGGKLFGWG
jgi:ferrous iron transport protein B